MLRVLKVLKVLTAEGVEGRTRGLGGTGVWGSVSIYHTVLRSSYVSARLGLKDGGTEGDKIR